MGVVGRKVSADVKKLVFLELRFGPQRMSPT